MSDDLLAHLAGDYLLQSDWMASEKTKIAAPAAAHAITYTLPFLALTRRWKPLAVIAGTHYVIDRYRLAKYVVWAKNQAAPEIYRHAWGEHVSGTGYHRTGGGSVDRFLEKRMGERPWDEACVKQAKPDYMAVWLLILADNTLHLLCNRWALKRWT